MLLRRANGLAYHNKVLRKVKEKAGVTSETTELPEIKSKLHETWARVDQIQKIDVVAREKTSRSEQQSIHFQ